MKSRSMMSRTKLAAISLLGASLLAGCGNKSSTGSTTPTGGGTSEAAPLGGTGGQTYGGTGGQAYGSPNP